MKTSMMKMLRNQKKISFKQMKIKSKKDLYNKIHKLDNVFGEDDESSELPNTDEEEEMAVQRHGDGTNRSRKSLKSEGSSDQPKKRYKTVMILYEREDGTYEKVPIRREIKVKKEKPKGAC